MEHPHHKSKRGLWTSRLGFIMASAGSAVGLGNIWKFPYITGMHGGGPLSSSFSSASRRSASRS